MEDLSKMKIADLKKRCKDNGLSTAGIKSDLLTRLQDHLNKGVTEDAVLNEAELLGELDAVDTQNSPVSNVDEDLLLGDSISDSKDESTEISISEAATILEKKDDVSTEDPPCKVQKTDENIKEIVSTPNGVQKDTEMTEEERLKLRAARFETKSPTETSTEEKKLERAKRFGIDVKSGESEASEVTPIDVEKLKKREERFGVSVSDTLKKELEEEKKRKRIERFGLSKNENSVSKLNDAKSTDTKDANSIDETKKIQRAARFATASTGVDEDKKKARAARFGMAN